MHALGKIVGPWTILASVVCVGVEVANHYYEYRQGQISWETFKEQSGISAVNGAVSTCGGVIGGAVGAWVGSVIPFVGTVIGAFIGALIGGIGAHLLSDHMINARSGALERYDKEKAEHSRKASCELIYQNSLRTLGVDAVTPRTEIKNRRRQWLLENHPDHVPADRRQEATERTQAFIIAYEIVKKEKDIRGEW